MDSTTVPPAFFSPKNLGRAWPDFFLRGLFEDWVNYTVEMTEGDSVILHVRNFDGLMDEDVKAALGKMRMMIFGGVHRSNQFIQGILRFFRFVSGSYLCRISFPRGIQPFPAVIQRLTGWICDSIYLDSTSLDGL